MNMTSTSRSSSADRLPESADPTVAGTTPPSNAVWSLAAELAPVGIVATEGDSHTIKQANGAFCRLVARERGALLGRAFGDAFPEAAGDGTLAMLDRVYHTGDAESVREQRREHPSSRVIYRSDDALPLLDAQGRVRGLLLYTRDTTDDVLKRHQADLDDEELRCVNAQLVLSGLRERDLADKAEHEATKLSALVDSLNAGVVLVDDAGRAVLTNRAARELLGPNLTEYGELGTGYEAQAVDGALLGSDQWPLRRALRGESFVDVDLAIARDTGEKRRLSVSGGPVLDKWSNVSLAMAVFQDVTKLRELEQIKEDYIALITHDLRSPLSMVMLFSSLNEELLRARGLEDEAKNSARVLKNAKLMEAMIQELLESACMESGGLEMHKVPTDLASVVSEVCEHAAAHENRQRIQLRCEPGLPSVLIDRSRIERAVTNLLGNAVKYSRPDSRIDVSLERTQSTIVFSVRDEGRGIGAEDLSRVFDRYYRARGTAADGTGLGLYITRLAVEAHGGRIWVTSEIDKGSTFSFALPIDKT